MESQNCRDSDLQVHGIEHRDPVPPAAFVPSFPIFLLAVAGGGLDAMIILAFNVLTAAQTGNTILLATSIASGDFANGLESAVSLTAFMAGVVAGSRLIVVIPDNSLAPALWLELALLGTLLGLWMFDQNSVLLVLLAAAAMGVQSAATLRLNAGSTTTYITGMLAAMGKSMGCRLTPPSAVHQPGTARRAGITWLAYFAGATICGMLFLRMGPFTLVLPMVCVLIFILYHHARTTSSK